MQPDLNTAACQTHLAHSHALSRQIDCQQATATKFLTFAGVNTSGESMTHLITTCYVTCVLRAPVTCSGL